MTANRRGKRFVRVYTPDVRPLFLLAAVFCAAGIARGRVTTAPALVDPTGLSEPDQLLLVETVRKAIEDAANRLAPRRPRYTPLVLRGRTARLRLALRSRGRLVCEYRTDAGPLLEIAAEGGTALGRELRRLPRADRRDPDRLGLEIEVCGQPDYLPARLTDEGRWTAELYASFAAGADGVGVELDDRTGWVTPGQIVAAGYSPDLALQHAEGRIRLSADEKRLRHCDVRYFRFPVAHLWQPPDERPVLLRSGVRLLAPEDVTAAVLDQALSELVDYLRYRRNRDGSFAYCYQPATDRYDDRNSATAQMAVLAALMEYARARPDPAAAEVARPLLTAALGNLRPLPDGGGKYDPRFGAAYVEFPGHEDKLGSAARLLLALAEEPLAPPTAPPNHLATRPAPTSGPARAATRAGAAADAAARLAAGLLSTQDERGQVGVRDPVAGLFAGSPELAAGTALLALARFDARTRSNRGDPVIESALRRAAGYYAERLASSHDLPAVAAHARALAAAYEQTRDANTGDAAFRLLDRLAAAQFTDPDGRRPELAGAIDLAGGAGMDIATADALAALCDGVNLSGLIGDAKRREQYHRAARRAARFVLQLRFRAEECYYVRSPRDVLGGYRTALWINSIPIDNGARALTGLARARRTLFGPWPAAPPAAGGGPPAAEPPVRNEPAAGRPGR